MAANDAVSMNVAENRQNVPMAIQENRAAVPMTVAEGGGTPGGLNRKADKVTGAVAGNLAGLDANGNLTDSGKAPGDFLEAPATAGSEGQVLTADGEGGASWQDPTGGDPTEIIDDTAGSGDTDKVWSADKSHELLTEITHGNAMTADAKSDIDQIAKDGNQKWFPEWERGEYNDTGKETNNNRMRSKNVVYLASGTYTIHTEVICSVFAYMNENISDGSNLLWRQTGDKTFTVTTRHYVGIVVDWDADDENVPTGNYAIIPSAVSDVIAQATATEAKATENRTLIDERTGFVDGIYTAVLENVTLQDNKGIGSGVAVGSVLTLTNDNYSQVMTAFVQAGRKYRIKAKVYNNYYLAHFTDANNVLIQKYVKNTTGQNYVFVDEVVTAPAGATKLYIAAMKSPKILLDVFNPYTIKDIVDMKTDARGAFCIMQFNVGDWYEGQYRDEDRSGAIPANETIYANYMELFHGIFGRYKPDIAMINEDAQEMCLNRHDDSRAFLGKYFRHSYRARMQSQDYTDVYNTISTSFDVFDVSTHYFTDTETNTTRNWIKGYTYLNGKKICLICTHLSPVWERGKANATELLNAVVEEDPEYLILCGDFNLLRNTAEVVAFETAGYVVSCGNTEHGGHTYGPGDFVITTSNINVKSVYCDTQKIEDPNVEYIDHLPTITYLEIY